VSLKYFLFFINPKKLKKAYFCSFMEKMEFDKIVAVAGSPGLYYVIGQRPNGLILQEVGNPSRKFATGARQKVSVLADIAMFTEEEDVKLGDVFIAAKAIVDKGDTLPSKKDDEKLIKAGFEKVLPNYDKERVYTSDMKKMFGWFHTLNGNFDFSKINETPEEEEEGSKSTEKKTTKAKKKKPVAPKNLNKKVQNKSGASKSSKITAPRKSS